MHLVEEVEEDGAWRYAEGNHVGQRVEFLSDGRGNAEGSCHHAVEEVEHGTYDNQQDGIRILPVKGTTGCHAAANEVAAGEGIGEVNESQSSKIRK